MEKGDHQCPDISQCSLECKYGRVKSLTNCELCECIEPCDDVKCKWNEVCVVKNATGICLSSKLNFYLFSYF